MKIYKFVWNDNFIRIYKKFVKSKPFIKDLLIKTLGIMQIDPFDKRLSTHKLHGQLKGLLASSINYEYRIIYTIETQGEDKMIIFVDIGSHDEVY